MQWLALACTAENELLAWNDNLSLLESACSGEFRAICRIYGIDDIIAGQLLDGNLDFRLQFNGPRNTDCVGHKKDTETEILSKILCQRVAFTNELHQRIAHGFKRFEPVVSWQVESYQQKYEEALNVTLNLGRQQGMVEDYAEEAGLNINVAAGLIINKYQNRKFLIRKLERLRIRHQIAIRKASTKEDFVAIRSAMEEDSFLSMLM
jgi:hypothetical protein